MSLRIRMKTCIRFIFPKGIVIEGNKINRREHFSSNKWSRYLYYPHIQHDICIAYQIVIKIPEKTHLEVKFQVRAGLCLHMLKDSQQRKGTN